MKNGDKKKAGQLFTLPGTIFRSFFQSEEWPNYLVGFFTAVEAPPVPLGAALVVVVVGSSITG